MSSHLSFLDDDALEALNVLATTPGMQKELNLAVAEIAKLLAATTAMPTAGDPGVITASGSDVPNSGSMAMVEACLAKDFFTVSVRVAACIDLLSRLALQPPGLTSTKAGNDKWHEDVDRFQSTLTKLLVRYPVLMHSYIVIAVKDQNGKLDYATVATAIARTGLATLPRVSHGVSEAELRKFASYFCVKHGLIRASPDRKIKSSTTATKSVPVIAFDKTRIVDRAWHAGAPFVSSLLEINELARQETGRPILHLQQSSWARDGLMAVCASGFWGLIGASTWNDSGIHAPDRADFVQAMQLPSAFIADLDVEEGDAIDQGPAPTTVSCAIGPSTAHRTIPGPEGESDLVLSEFHHALALNVDKALFLSGLSTCNRHDVMTRTEQAISLLVDISATPNTESAALWLAAVTVGTSRTANDTCPNTTLDSAVGFLEVLDRHGVLVPAQGHLLANTPTASGNLQVWQRALQVNETKVVMHGVIAAARAGANVQQHPDQTDRPSNRRRMGGV